MTVEQLLDKLPYRIPGSQANYCYLEMFKTENGYMAGYYRDDGKAYVSSPIESSLKHALHTLWEWYEENNYITK